MSDPREAARAAEAKEALARIKRDEEGFLGSSMARAAEHFSGGDAPANEPAELWGRRVGRMLSLVGVVVLAWWLGQQLKIW